LDLDLRIVPIGVGEPALKCDLLNPRGDAIKLLLRKAVKRQNMKLLARPSPLIRHTEAAELLTSKAVLSACESAGWLKPCVRRKKLTVYNRTEVLAAAHRILSGEYPIE